MNINYKKSLEEIIAENNQIIESTITDEGLYSISETPIEAVIGENSQIIESQDKVEIHPLYLDKTIEDKIAEDNAIIESSVAQVAALDFESINKKSPAVNTIAIQ